MTLLRNVFTDLVDKKLWPVAAVLIVALVAIPLLLAGGGSAAAPLPAAPVPTGDQPAVVVTPAEGKAGKGAQRVPNDPFRRRTGVVPGLAPASAAGAPTPTGVPAASPTGPTAAASPAAGGVPNMPSLEDIGVVPVGDSTGSTGDTSAPDRPSTSPAGAPANLSSWQVDVRFGPADAVTAREDLARLSPLPSATEPYFVFLGVAADGETALFLVTSDAQASGDGVCSPSAESCERVALEAGQSETFDVVTPAGEVVRYQLDVASVTRTQEPTAAQAAAARARESAAGRQVLRTAVETQQVDVSDLAYSRDLGIVVPSGRTAANGDQLFGGFRVDLQFGAPGALVKRYNLARLTPLPSVESPSFLFLGVLGDGATAMFLNPSEAATRGDGVCLPSPEECQRVTLQSGQSTVFDTPAIDGSTTEYQLDVDAITPVQAATAEEAEASRRRESPAGRVILRRLITEVGGLVQDLTFSGGKGVVQPAAPAE